MLVSISVITAIVDKMHDAGVFVFATPIYYYEISGRLKTLLDRAKPLYGSDYRYYCYPSLDINNKQ